MCVQAYRIGTKPRLPESSPVFSEMRGSRLKGKWEHWVESWARGICTEESVNALCT